jgi:uncharacterized membrane protein (UPF0127 family)
MVRLSFIGNWLLAAMLVLSAVMVASVRAETAADPLAIEELTVVTGEADRVFMVEVAATDAQRAKGLMFRERMALNTGMLFVFDTVGERIFWMKNTPLSLDIIFIDADGRIIRIAEGTEPFSERYISSNGPALYVLEVVAGTSRRLGISVGDLVKSPSVEARN